MTTQFQLFLEADEEWQAIPSWVAFLIRLGYGWPSRVSGRRRIAVVSMPCDSAGVGLIALGALVRDLGNPTANDLDQHYDRILKNGRQYLDSCRNCEVRCRPEEKDCGYTSEATGRLRHRGRTVYTIAAADLRSRRFLVVRPDLDWWPNPSRALEWQIDGEPPTRAYNDQGTLAQAAYVGLVEGATFFSDNLRRSFSGLCLASKVAGASATLDACAAIRFRSRYGDQRLSDLLTAWSPRNSVSRIALFNSRTEELNRSSAPALIVADGDGAFLKIVGRTRFQHSDVIGVIHRALERDRLEDVGNKMASLRQWYTDDHELLRLLPALPRGITVSILQRVN
jgi:hypothetical protein